MSTILDSLKKSSDQRSDNEKGSIDNFNFAKDKGSKKNNSFLFTLILLFLTAAIMYFGYDYLYSDNNESIELKQQAEVKPKIDATNSQTIEKTASTDKNKKTKPDNKTVKQRIKDIKHRKQEEQQALAALNRPQEKKTSSSKSSGKYQKPEPTKQKAPIKLSLPNNQKKPEPKEQKKPELKQPKINVQKYKYVYQLPFAIRKDIPKLTLNVHVYDENPENRIAIINGVRFNIDDMIEEQVLVKDIVQEGVLLDFNNREFLIPKL